MRPCGSQVLKSVAGVTVSIAAFQAVDPGSIPGPRTVFHVKFSLFFQVCRCEEDHLSPPSTRLSPPSPPMLEEAFRIIFFPHLLPPSPLVRRSVVKEV